MQLLVWLVVTSVAVTTCVARNHWWRLDGFDILGNSTIDYIEPHTYIRRIENDVNLVHSCYEYFTNSSTHKVSGSFCYPSIIITGVRKCSTSAMYAFLSSYPRTLHLRTKENCPITRYRSIVEYFATLPSNIEAGYILIDGCVDIRENLQMRTLLRNPNTFFVLLTRDYSDWIWSAYNYWCKPSFENNCLPGPRWAHSGDHYRSANSFHKIVSDSINGLNVSSPLDFDNPCVHARTFFSSYIHNLRAAVPAEAVLFIASEELDSNPQKVWTKLAQRSGLLTNHPQINKFDKYRYNTQEIRSDQRVSNHPDEWKVAVSEHRPGVYEISSYEPLRKDTRSVLDKCWMSDCIVASNATAFRYAACPTVKVTPLQSSPKGLGFLYKRVEACQQEISAVGKTIVDPTMVAQSHNRVLLLMDNSNPLLVASISDLPTAVTVLALSQCDNDCAMAGGTAVILFALVEDVYDVRKSPSYGATSNVISEYILTINDASDKKKRQKIFLLNRIVVLVRDPLQPLLNILQGSAKTLHLFNWSAFEEQAESHLQSYTVFSIVQHANPAHVMFVSSQQLMSNTTLILHSALDWVGFNGSIPPAWSSLAACKYATQLYQHRNVLDTLFPQPIDDKSKERRQIMLASVPFACKLDQFVRNHTFGYMDLELSGISGACSNITATTANSTCALRYATPGPRQLDSFVSPVALVADYGVRTTTLRYITEALTGVWTGSVKRNATLSRYFAGENVCPRPSSFVFAHPTQLKLSGQSLTGNLKSSARDNQKSSSSWSMEIVPLSRPRCGSLNVKSFSKFLILVDDPVLAIVNAYKAKHCHPSSNNNNNDNETASTSLSLHAQSDAFQGCTRRDENALVAEAKRLSLLRLMSHDIQATIASKFPAADYLVMSYEYLVHRATRQAAADTLLHFLGFPSASAERFQCAFAMVDPPEVEAVSSAVRALRHHPQQLCAMKRALEESVPKQCLQHTLAHALGHSCGGVGKVESSWVREQPSTPATKSKEVAQRRSRPSIGSR